jgi:hypothetical protein
MDEGTGCPTTHVAAVMDTCSDTEAAVAALRRAGFVAIHQFHGVEAFVAIQAASRYESPLIRAVRRVCELGDEGRVRHYLLAALYRGGSVLFVSAATPLQGRHICDILARRHAHYLWRLGDLTVEHVPVWSAEGYD